MVRSRPGECHPLKQTIIYPDAIFLGSQKPKFMGTKCALYSEGLSKTCAYSSYRFPRLTEDFLEYFSVYIESFMYRRSFIVCPMLLLMFLGPGTYV